MRPGLWSPPVGPSPAEQAVMRAVRRARLFVFLREHRHELFDEGFQAKLAQAYADSPKGRPPVPRTLPALAVPACGRHHLGLDELRGVLVRDDRSDQRDEDGPSRPRAQRPRAPGRPSRANRTGQPRQLEAATPDRSTLQAKPVI
jgi:hypothetical protein